MDITLITVAIVVAALAGLVGFFWGKSRSEAAGLRQMAEEKENYELRLREEQTKAETRIAEERSRAEKQVEEERQRADLRVAEEQKKAEKRIEQLHSDREVQMERLSAWIKEQEADIKAHMNLTANELLSKQSAGLNDANRTQISEIVDPLKEKILQWETSINKVEESYRERMSALDATIRTTLERTEQVGARADRLANALTSENKTQGNFGEMRLRQMLLDMGFEEGVQFKEQETMRDAQGFVINAEDNGQRLIPDVMLYFPDNRDIVIDSKLSLTAFERYHNAANDDEKNLALKEHVRSVRCHVEELSRKDYSKYIVEGHQKLDFVVMYMPVEGALQLALSADPNLWKEAYDRGVFITGSQNLYALLRVLDLSWKQVQQVRNQKEIMAEANRIIERTQLFHERLLAMEKQFQGVQNAFDNLRTVTAPNGPSIITSARQLISYGAKENPKKQPLPKNQLVEE